MSRNPSIPPIIAAVAVIAALYAWAVVALTPAHPGAIGLDLNALGSDYTVFYSGLKFYFDGKLPLLFDGDLLTAYRNTTFAHWLAYPSPFLPWVYPPNFLLLLLPFGLLSFLPSYILFTAITAALLALALWYGADRRETRVLVLVAALLGPAAAINVSMGQNAFLTAALLVGGMRLARTRPALGGIVLGLATIKPQFWVLVPVALAADRQWRALVWCFAGAALLALASAAVFGLDVWRQWIELAGGNYWTANAKWVGYGRAWGTSVFAGVAALGQPAAIADLAQSAAIVLGIGLTWLGTRLRLPPDLKIANLLACTILAAPHSSIHDLVLLGAAAALWSGNAAQLDRPLAHWTLALALWLTAIFNPPAATPIGSITPLLIVGFSALILVSNRAAVAAVPTASTAPAPGPSRPQML
ncbi:MAG: DUF2029 domain-containing protein [Alphaproteobacteria bacterium]|nr:DUF2029 domain-containing protein [Alphaproteobacteria bacterium]